MGHATGSDMPEIKFAHHLPIASPIDGLLSPEQCLQRAADCEQLGMIKLAAKWRQLAEQTAEIKAAAGQETTLVPKGSS
jgi:hypothetical protein